MASHVVVTSSTARSAKVKVSPGTYMSDVLDQACKTLHLEAGNYLLKHKQRNVDLSVPFRISGLVGGAKLDLVIKSKSPSPVTVAVAIPPPDGAAFSNGRLGGAFPSSFTIWQVLRQIESLPEAVAAKLNITARGVAATTNGGTSGSGQLLYETPVLNVMGRELGSFQDYQRTLSQLGYNSGSVLMRLSYKTTGITFFEAQQEISQYFQELEEAKPETPASSASPPVPTPLSSAQTETPDELSPEPDAQMQDAPALAATISQTDGASQAAPLIPDDSVPVPRDPLAPVDIFSAPSSSTLAASLTAVDDDDFTPTIAHAQLHQASLQDRSKNKRLLSDKELAERAAATEEKISSIQSIEVKVRFPDMTSATWVITHDDTGAKLYKAVRSVMADPSLPFRLVISGSKDAIRDVDAENNRVMRVHKITGRVLLNVLWDDSVSARDRAKPFLKSSAAQAAKSIVVPGVPAGEEEEKAPPAKQQQAPRQGDSSRTGDETMKKIGKFFKLPGKK